LDTAAADSPSSSLTEKRNVALSSLLAAVVLTSVKVVVGLSTGSLGILSEAAHSGLDLVAAAVTFWAVRAASRPADRDHTYGHGKVENLSALVETMLLLLTCVWIGWESIQRLFFENVKVDANLWSFAVMALSIGIDVSRSRALARAAKKYGSQALEADALHFSTDVWSSSVVIGGLAGVVLSRRLGLPWLEKADAVAALGVAAIVVWVSIQLGKKSIDDLLDAVPADLRDQVAAAAQVPGVLDVQQLRLRRSGPGYFADVTLTVSREASLERAHAISEEVERAIGALLPGADVVVHSHPVASGNEGTIATLRFLAARRALGIHAIRIYQGGRRAECHLELPEALSLREAHDLASAFEEESRNVLPGLERLVTHLEPTGEESAQHTAVAEDAEEVRAALEKALAECGLHSSPSDLVVQRVSGMLSVSFRHTLDGSLSLAEAHRQTEAVERALRARVPEVGRVLAHLEPSEEPTTATGRGPRPPPPG
jgi:cation diffusion facilitator family transporter